MTCEHEHEGYILSLCMQERTLLILSLLTAIIGVATLWVLPERGADRVTGLVSWQNDTRMLVLEQHEVWVQTALTEPLPEGSCVVFEGFRSGEQLAEGRLLQVRPPSTQRCP